MMNFRPGAPHLFAFDINSHFSRVFKVQAPNDQSPTHPGARYMGEPVFCLKPLLSLVEKEIRLVSALGYPNTHIVIVFDHASKNFRHDMYPAYKANRKQKTEDFLRQEALMFEMFRSLGYPCLRVQGVEADDVLATLAYGLSKRGVYTTLFSGDKDTMSFVGDFVQAFAGREKKLYQSRQVEEKFGIPPSRLLDFLAMKGDSADNVPGVSGIGDTIATAILQRYSLDEMLENPDVLAQIPVRGSSKLPQLVRGQAAQLQLSRRLVGLKTDVELAFNFRDMQRKAPMYSDFLSGYMRPGN